MATTTRRPKTDAELRALGVPPDVIAYRRGKTRVWVGPIREVEVDGVRCPEVPVSREVMREELAAKVRAARRRRFHKRVA